MYQSLEPEPEGAICPKRSCLRQRIALLTTLYQYAYWLKWIIQGITPCFSQTRAIKLIDAPLIKIIDGFGLVRRAA